MDEFTARLGRRCARRRRADRRPSVPRPEQLRLLAPFLPPYARADGAGGRRARRSTTPEHRRTVIVFVNILGLNEVIATAGVDAALGQLQTYSAMLTRLAAKHHGFVVSSDIATKGSKLVVTFGAPVAHEYAPANAARFALDLNAGLRESGLDLQHKIGVNGGHVFAGEVGPLVPPPVHGHGRRREPRGAADGAPPSPGETLVSRNLLDYVEPRPLRPRAARPSR